VRSNNLSTLSFGILLSVISSAPACASGRRWVKEPFEQNSKASGIRLYDEREHLAHGAYDKRTAHLHSASPEQKDEANAAELTDGTESRPQLALSGAKKGKHTAPPDGRLLGEFRNTYYDFPAESEYGGSVAGPQAPAQNAATSAVVALMNAACQPIKEVARGFFESLCVQGSGTLLDGRTVSFAKRDCACAEVCPRTSQKICFDALDPAEFPWGRGALGKAIVPLSTVAVDSTVIALGTHLYVAEYDGVQRHPGGGLHNGCFVAEDRGMKVKGQHIDIFTGNPRVTKHLNALVPSNQGVHVYLDTTRCK